MPLTPTHALRPARPDDWDAVAALLRAHALPLDGAREHLSTFLVAVAGDRVVGCAGAEVHGDAALLRSVAVDPAWQHRGVGRQLVTRLVAEASRRGLRQLGLRTTTAADWFRRLGFERRPPGEAPVALRASAGFGGACPADAAFMALDLVEAPPAAAPHLAAWPVVVIGAGPVGLAAAARLIERGIEPVVLEAGASVGAHLLDYGHVRLFSPWRYDVDAAMAAQLEATGWRAPPPDELPLAREVVERVLQPYAALPAVRRALHLHTRVTAISREGFDKVKSAGRDAAPFVVRAVQHGRERVWRACAVIDCSGTWGSPNPLGADGLPAAGEREHADAVFYGIPDVLGRDRARYAGQRTLVVGAGHSAANTLLALADLAAEAPGTELVWAVRSPAPARVFGGGAADALPARGALGSALKALRDGGALRFVAGLRIAAVRRDGATLTIEGQGPDGVPMRIDGVHQIVCATGQRPDLATTRELRLRLDPWLESTEALGPLIDPNVHSCGTVRPHGHRELSHPEPGFYTLGVKSYGRAPTFLMATGFEQARSVAAAIAGDVDAADRVELDLPETGVCGVDPSAPAPVTAGFAPAPLAAGDCGLGGCGRPAAPPVRREAARCCA